ncbi:MAG: signal peptidase I [Bryobacteraceae bacterium]
MEQETPAQNSAPPIPHKRSPLGAVLYWARDLFLAVIIAIIVILFLYQPVKVEGTSMMPALNDQERIFINKFIYQYNVGKIERGDMVVFWYPNDVSKSYIKRVIGIPGDRVKVDRGTVVIDGKRLDETYVPREYRDDTSMASQVIPPDEYFVLGDHRSSSNDSRSWGLVPRRDIYGKAVFVYWPLDKLGLLR